MKASLTYSIPEEEAEFRNALEGASLRQVIWQLDQRLRSRLKYGMLPAAEQTAYQQVRDELHQLISEHKVEIE